jgi:predicted AAA+ superfamily ATPase
LRKFEIGDKYFFEDIGLRNCHIGFSLQRDIHKLLENAVFLHLKNLQYEVFVGKKDNLEIDFVGIKQGRRIYVQVVYLLADENTRKREFGNLKAISDNYPKYVVSLDEFFRESDFEGIKHLNLRNFLCRNNLE